MLGLDPELKMDSQDSEAKKEPYGHWQRCWLQLRQINPEIPSQIQSTLLLFNPSPPLSLSFSSIAAGRSFGAHSCS
ncbi:hypothetical protein ES319_D05G239200v1 [Gossypium barbadense]|uniref:Uncharacterized protein n=2 Tax=Gossypium TaxID=3633 RepID=A0A5J5RPC6_GOSBA|nr:hypothetical protein ES319_D05G239200v1 [Gossypium barbadense]TYG69685.1 hypothetical protein ES288_D05G250700v1 [Gossypium darwinii]